MSKSQTKPSKQSSEPNADKSKDTTYHKIYPGEPFTIPIGRGGVGLWCIKCCDCGLKHTILIRPRKRTLLVGIWRHDNLAGVLLPKEETK